MHSLLYAHNARRAHHAAGDLTLNEELCAAAQRWADELVRRDSFEHSLQRYNGSLVGLRRLPSSLLFSSQTLASLASPYSFTRHLIRIFHSSLDLLIKSSLVLSLSDQVEREL